MPRNPILFGGWMPALLLLGAVAAGGTHSAPATQTAPAAQTGPARELVEPSAAAAATALADRLAQALGGWEAWNQLRYLRFAFVVEKDGQQLASREHLWDKRAGRARVEWSDKEGHSWIATLDLATRGGRALRDGQEVSGEDLSKALERAYGAWVNDTYWLVMPFKTRDPGVHLAAEGTEQVEGRPYEKLALSFDRVGLTPGDHYWVYINKATGVMDRWAYVLEDQQPPPTVWEWRDWRELGGVRLSAEKDKVGDQVKILMRGLSAPASVPQELLTDPTTKLPGD